MGKIIRQFLIWSSSGLIVILAIWLVVGNFIATEQEKKIDAAKEQFRKQFPKQEANNSALKLEELTAKLGILVTTTLQNTPARSLHSSRYEAKAKEFEKIREELSNYINSQLEKPNDEIDIPPKKLQQYLSSNADLLEEIQDHVLKSESPQWESVDFSNHTASDPLPSFSSFANLQKLLTFNILEKTRLGQHQEALKSLEVSWKINQSLLRRPYLIDQLVYIIIARPQAAVMQKMSNLSPIWQSRIERNIKYKLPQYFLPVFESESLLLSNNIRVASASDLGKLFKDLFGVFERLGLTLSNNIKIASVSDLNNLFKESFGYWDQVLFFPSGLQILDPLYRPYFRLAGVDYWDKMNRAALELPKEYHCSFEAEKVAKKYNIARTWWNFADPNSTGQWGKVIKLAVQMELTQKVLQVKEIANKQGNWPKQVPEIESSAICKDAKWIYAVAENGTMSISLSKEFEWFKKQPNQKDYIPLSYSAKYKRNLKLKEGL